MELTWSTIKKHNAAFDDMQHYNPKTYALFQKYNTKIANLTGTFSMAHLEFIDYVVENYLLNENN